MTTKIKVYMHFVPLHDDQRKDTELCDKKFRIVVGVVGVVINNLKWHKNQGDNTSRKKLHGNVFMFFGCYEGIIYLWWMLHRI